MTELWIIQTKENITFNISRVEWVRVRTMDSLVGPVCMMARLLYVESRRTTNSPRKGKASLWAAEKVRSLLPNPMVELAMDSIVNERPSEAFSGTATLNVNRRDNLQRTSYHAAVLSLASKPAMYRPLVSSAFD